MSVNITIENNGKNYTAHVADIRNTRLGWEDHGILTANLDLRWEGSGVSAGGYCLDTADKDVDSGYDRAGTAYGLDHIMRIMQTVGVEKWEDLKGKQVYVLFPEGGGWGSMCSGIANLSTGSAFIFKEHANSFRELEAAK